MLKINDKTFMNIQEAVQWLLDNNCVPFQCTANYVANTEIGLGTIVNPSPAKVRIGSLIFFADSKVSTVVGVTSNGFIVSDQYNDLVDDVVYVSNVAINASGHLIVTLSNGDAIDAGLIKQVTGFSIDGSQHLIVSYNDSTTTDLGPIFSGNITISGNLTATGGISGNAITGDSIIENMSGYSFNKSILDDEHRTLAYTYAGVVKNGNKITFALAGTIVTKDSSGNTAIGSFTIPASVGTKLFPTTIGGIPNILEVKNIVMTKSGYSTISCPATVFKISDTQITASIYGLGNLTQSDTYYWRVEVTFLLSENLVS